MPRNKERCTMSAFEATLDRMLDTSSSSDFIACDSFVGSRPGYVFKRGGKGIGYYLDIVSRTEGGRRGSNKEKIKTGTGTTLRGKKRPRPVNGGMASSVGGYTRSSFDQTSESEKRIDEESHGVRFGANTEHTKPTLSALPAQKTAEEVLADAERIREASTTSRLVVSLDGAGVVRATSTFAKTWEKNQLLRARHPGDPSKFVDSELALHDELQALQAIAAQPTLYRHVVNGDGAGGDLVGVLMGVFAHENVDVVLALIETWNELLDVNLISGTTTTSKGGSENDDARYDVGLLATSFLDHGGLDLLANTLGRFDPDLTDVAGDIDDDEDEEVWYKGIDGILTLIETLLDIDSLGILQDVTTSTAAGTSATVGDSESCGGLDIKYESVTSKIWRICPSLVSWLLDRVGRRRDGRTGSRTGLSELDVRSQASELLATILQHEDSRVPASVLGSMPPLVVASGNDDNLGSKTRRNGSSSRDGTLVKKTKSLSKNDKVDGIEMLLQAVAPYRRKNPATLQECEHLENCLDALSAALLENPVQGNANANLAKFIEAQGIELMLRCIQACLHSGSGCLRVLHFALSRNDEGEVNGDGSNDRNRGGKSRCACEHFVDAGGLKIIFPILMGRAASIPRPAKCSDAGSDYLSRHKDDKEKLKTKRAREVQKARREWLNTVESNAVNIVYALTWHLHDDSPFDAKARLLAKFVESDYEKCDRLIELCFEYDEKMRLAEAKYIRSEEAELAELDGVDVNLAALQAKLSGGADIFHRVGAILAFACVGSKRCHGHVLEQLRLNKSGISLVRAALEEFITVLDAGIQKSRLKYYLTLI